MNMHASRLGGRSVGVGKVELGHGLRCLGGPVAGLSLRLGPVIRPALLARQHCPLLLALHHEGSQTVCGDTTKEASQSAIMRSRCARAAAAPAAPAAAAASAARRMGRGDPAQGPRMGGNKGAAIKYRKL
eukprot:TRINITY_DN14926_c0_g2_i2.p2 TRINITY_DN14926_c0_g2~~TRINITY_DN14926_c0_g2_i2.p2  ORF type:complete len:130 (-),score=4.34 TRINITY_DN14926_c0_g2_i2:7-396(-)